MDKLYAIKIRQSDGTYGAAIPVSVLAENVDWNSTLSLVDILGQVDTSESIQDQINNLKNTKATQASVNALDQKVDNAVEYITHNSEIADAREGADGTEYSTLKERLDSEFVELALQSDLDEIAVDVAAAQTSIANIQQITNRLTNRYIIFCGDSYTAGYNPDGDSFTSWANICASALGLTSSDYKITASAGCGLLRGTTYLQQLTNLTVPDDDAVTDIVVAGGTNDVSYTKLDLLTALEALISYCKTRYPNAIVHMVCIGWTNNANNRLLLIRNVQSVYKQASAYGGDYIVGSEYLLHNYGYFCDDMSHPNQTGQTLLGVAIANGLLTGHSLNYYQTEENLVIDPYTTLFTTVPLTLNQYLGLDGVQLVINGGFANFKSGLTALNNDYDCKLGTLSARKGFIAGITESLAGINVSVKITYVNGSGTSVFVVRPATFWIDSNFAVHVRVHLDGANIGGNSLTSLYIYPTSATLKYAVI